MHCSVKSTALLQSLVAQARVLRGALAMAFFNSTFNDRLTARLSNQLSVAQITRVQSDYRGLDEFTVRQQATRRRTLASAIAGTGRVCAGVAARPTGLRLPVNKPSSQLADSICCRNPLTMVKPRRHPGHATRCLESGSVFRHGPLSFIASA